MPFPPPKPDFSVNHFLLARHPPLSRLLLRLPCPSGLAASVPIPPPIFHAPPLPELRKLRRCASSCLSHPLSPFFPPAPPPGPCAKVASIPARIAVLCSVLGLPRFLPRLPHGGFPLVANRCASLFLALPNYEHDLLKGHFSLLHLPPPPLFVFFFCGSAFFFFFFSFFFFWVFGFLWFVFLFLFFFFFFFWCVWRPFPLPLNILSLLLLFSDSVPFLFLTPCFQSLIHWLIIKIVCDLPSFLCSFPPPIVRSFRTARLAVLPLLRSPLIFFLHF